MKRGTGWRSWHAGTFSMSAIARPGWSGLPYASHGKAADYHRPLYSAARAKGTVVSTTTPAIEHHDPLGTKIVPFLLQSLIRFHTKRLTNRVSSGHVHWRFTTASCISTFDPVKTSNIPCRSIPQSHEGRSSWNPPLRPKPLLRIPNVLGKPIF